MSRITIIIFSFLLSGISLAAQASCDKYVKAYNTYEELVGGQIVSKYSVFSVTDWSEDSAFEGLLLTKEAPEKAELRISIPFSLAIDSTDTFEVWSQNSEYRKANFDPEKVFSNASKAKAFTLELRSGGQVLCTELKEFLREE